MTRRPKAADDLDEYQRTVLAGMIARREFDLGFRLSALQKQAILKNEAAWRLQIDVWQNGDVLKRLNRR